MKKLLCFLTIFTFAAINSFGQDCQNSYYTKKGSTIETTEYGASKEIRSITVNVVTTVKNAAGETTSDIHSVKTQNGKVADDKTLHYSCSPDQVIWGVGVDDTKTKKEAAFVYPKNMSNGQDLKTNAVFEYQETNAEGQTAKLSVKVNNRKVEGSENVSTKAGSWKCTKITYDFELKLKLGIIGIPLKAKVTEWYNSEVGVVRSEVRSKDKLESYSEITAVKAGK